MHSCECQNLRESLLRIFCDKLGVLVGAPDSDAVVGSISKREVSCLCCLVELLLQLLWFQIVQLDWAWELLFVVELFTQTLWK